jgi:EmrB/QacA subfamily drug resistance transporter
MDTKAQETGSYKWALITSVLASSMAFIDGSALNVALSALQRDLHSSALDLLWIMNSYNIPVSALILLGGALGDRFGIKKIFSIGIIIFLGASIMCGLAPNSLLLIVARAVQGIGGALMIPSSLSYLTISTSNENRGKAIGAWSSFSTLTTILGPILGGLFAEAGLWRFVFYLNVPLGIGALWTLYSKNKLSEEMHSGSKIDYSGAALITVGLALLSGSLLTKNTYSAQQLTMAGVAIALFIAFIFLERNKKNPMIPFQIFKSRIFTGVNLMTVLLYSTLYGVLFFVPLNLIQIQKYSDSIAGLASLPFVAMVILLSPLAGHLLDKFGPRPLLTFGPLVVATGFLFLAFTGVTSGPKEYWTHFFVPQLLMGIGMGFTIAPLTTTVMSALPSRQSGLASGINNAAARVSGVLAVGVFGLVFISVFKSEMTSKISRLNLSSGDFGLIKDQFDKLAAIQLPSTLSEGVAHVIHSDILEAFVLSFKNVCFLGVLMCVLSSLVAFATMKKAKQKV